MVQLVEQMLELHKRQAAAASEHDRALYQRQIEATDREMDKLVYDLQIERAGDCGNGKKWIIWLYCPNQLSTSANIWLKVG